jgi:hypothetical protein
MLPSVFKTCIPREEILAGELSPELFAAKLRLVVEGKAPHVYQDPTAFFANTFATDGLKTLISEVFGRLVGAAVGSPIIRLETSFGGGKTHDEIALWHIAKNGRDISGLDRFADLNLIPDRPIQAAAIACQDLDPVNGVYHADTGVTTYTLWGEIAPPIVEKIFNETGESGKFRTFRNRLLFLVANRQELDRAIDNAREFKAIQNILNSPNRLQDLSESQQKQLKDKKGALDLGVRVSLTNAYRHLFYPATDPVKAPKGLMHYPLAAQDASDVKGKNNQQDVILKALKDCQKIRADEAPSYAPAYILQKVWPSGLTYWTTKALKEAFAKDLGLNILLDAEISKLRDTIRQGLHNGSWDMKVGEKVFVHGSPSTVNSQQSTTPH